MKTNLWIGSLFIYGVVFTSIVTAAGQEYFDWSEAATFGIGFLALPLSLIPILRTLLLASALLVWFPWYGAFPLTLAIAFFRLMIVETLWQGAKGEGIRRMMSDR